MQYKLIYSNKMKCALNLLLLSAFLFVLMSCKEPITVESDLNFIESIMDQHPDSALKVLEGINSPEDLSHKEYATYCLLLTQARDKNYFHFTSDSIINNAVTYFIKQKDPYRKAQAYFYLGRVNHELNQPEKAAESYLSAVPYAKEIKKYKMLTLIYNHLGNLYRRQEWDEKALEATLEAIDYCRLAEDTMNLPYIIRNVGRIYMCIPQLDSAEVYYVKALDCAVQYQNVVAEASILNDLAITYRQVGEYRKGITSMKRSLELNDKVGVSSRQLTLGSLYLLINRLDSAEMFLKKARNSVDIYTQLGASHFLYQKALKEKDYKTAVDYNEEYMQKHDSIRSIQQQDEIQKLTYKYEKNELKRNLELKAAHARNVYMGVIIFLLVIMSVGCCIYLKYRWTKERTLRLQDKMLQREKNLRLRSETEYRQVLAKLESYRYQEYEKSKTDLELIQADLLHNRDLLIEKEEELIILKKREVELQNSLFDKTGLGERIKAAGVDPLKLEVEIKPFTSKELSVLITTLNEVYSDFIARLKEDYPNLSDTEIAICALLKAGARTKNIAFIIPMTPNAVSKKKNQIMKKIGIIDEVASLERFLEAF